MDESGWEVDPDDEWGVAVIATVGRQLKLRREAVGMRAAEFGTAVGYGEDLVYKVEGGKRIPRREYLEKADQVLGAGGLIAATWEDVKKVRYPKQVRDLAKMESRAVESLSYGSYSLHGLLQTEEYARALLGRRRPALTEDETESAVAARMGRKAMFERVPAPELSFVQEEATLMRPVGGRMVLRRQLEHLLEVGRSRHVEIQVMPTARGDHPGRWADAGAQVRGRHGGRTGRRHVGGRPVTDPRQLRILELRYGSIRAEALSARESVAFVEQLLGET
ncbi:helix-turn-helix domain-containing protein [Streptomyces thinghirensis]|nr:helix-turn-helix domain-containing protein [Streptomyces thinghirensis]